MDICLSLRGEVCVLERLVKVEEEFIGAFASTAMLTMRLIYMCIATYVYAWM